MKKLIKVKCPHCDTIFSYYESAFRPFCSERCKMIDLGHWFEESYRVPTKEINQENREGIDEESDQGNESEQFDFNENES